MIIFITAHIKTLRSVHAGCQLRIEEGDSNPFGPELLRTKPNPDFLIVPSVSVRNTLAEAFHHSPLGHHILSFLGP